MNIWWHVLVGCSSVVQILAQENGHGHDCHGWDGCWDGPGDPGGGGRPNDTQLDQRPPKQAPRPDNDDYDDCKPWQGSTSNGCRNCSDLYDECNFSMECCDGLFCGSDGFCACGNDSKECGQEDDDHDDTDDDGTLLEAAKIALAVALFIALIAASVLLWRTYSKYRRRRNVTPDWQAQRRARQHSSLTSVQRYVLSRLCDRPPRYEDNSFIQEEKPPTYEMVIATVATPMSTACLSSNTAPFGGPHAVNDAYIEDETERSSVASHDAGRQLCPACLCHCTSVANQMTSPETVQHEASHPPQNSLNVLSTCRTAQATATPQRMKAVPEHCCSREYDRHDSECAVASVDPEEHKHIRTESHT